METLTIKEYDIKEAKGAIGRLLTVRSTMHICVQQHAAVTIAK